MSNNSIGKVYGVHIKDISCPGCGRRYGHHKTKVDTISRKCSSCVKQQSYTEVNLVSAEEFIQGLLS